MSIELNWNSKILGLVESQTVRHAADHLARDLKKACVETKKSGSPVILKMGLPESECFKIAAEEDSLTVYASDEMGFIYGIYEISRRILGIHNFWFWNDQKIIRKEKYTVPDEFIYESNPYKIRFRGWFVNDEVLIHTWSVDRSQDKPWEMVFEALLRCGGNMVIPGTDRNSEKYRPLAAAMGLYITHHHAEPLGAEMFARVYPKLNPSFEEYPEKFRGLWRDGIEKQKGMKVIWNIGFRGQGDCPFWVNDPRYETQESRGELMSRLMREQYDLVKSVDPNAVCCTNLYGETMELYRDGCLSVPDDVIKIWADNGFGKMVTRRQENHNPRIYALPEVKSGGSHGIYYHVSFYDLQAANHITMLPNPPEFVEKELCEVMEHEGKDYWLVNCSNVKPHVYYLDFISEIWKKGNVNIEEHRNHYISEYYGKENVKIVAESMKDYFRYALPYGKYEDEHAGEQFSNHVARMLICQYMKDKDSRMEELLWATDSETLEGQVEWYFKLCQKAADGYKEYVRRCVAAETEISERGKTIFSDSLMLQAKIHYYCYQGARQVCRALTCAMKGKYQEAFYLAGKARECYLKADNSMRAREHGKWHNFYENECLTDIKQTAWVLESLMGYVRMQGDGPHFYQWQRDFLYSEEDRRVMLIMNMENHLKDLELFELMKEKWEG